MAHQVTLDSGAATSCIPVDLAAALGYKPVQPDGMDSKIYKTALGKTVKDLGKINAMVTIGIGNGALTGQCSQLSSDGSLQAITVCRSPRRQGLVHPDEQDWRTHARDGKKIPISFCNGVYSVPSFAISPGTDVGKSGHGRRGPGRF